MVGSATLLAKAMPAGLENMELNGDIGHAPGIKHFERSPVSHRLVIGGDRNEHGRCAGRRRLSGGVSGIDGSGKIGACLGCAPDRAQDHRAAGREADDADAIGFHTVSGGVLANQANGLLAIGAAHGPDILTGLRSRFR